jgi:hypothetical protein
MLVCGVCLLPGAVAALRGADWPGWRGPGRTGVSPETGLLKAWPKGGPRLVWQSDQYLTQSGLVSVRAADGALLWRHRPGEGYGDVVCPTPLVRGDRVYVTVGYGGGSQGLKVTGDGKAFKVEVVYTEPAIGSRQRGAVLVGDHVYGHHEDLHWACQEFARGARVWPPKPTRHAIKAGSLLAADGRLYVLDERANVAMLDASPAGFRVLGQFKLPRESKNRKSRGGLWAHPALSDGKLYLRDQELVFCYQVR